MWESGLICEGEGKMSEEKKESNWPFVKLLMAAFFTGYISGGLTGLGAMWTSSNDTERALSKCDKAKVQLMFEKRAAMLQPNEIEYLPIEDTIPYQSCICLEPGREHSGMKVTYTKNYGRYRR
jgi:hypothetical protein